MENNIFFSRRKLFNVARYIAGVSLKSFSESIGSNVSSSLVLTCLNGAWHNEKIDNAIDEFIGINISTFVAWVESDRSMGLTKKQEG